MDVDQIFSKPFHQQAQKTQKQLSKWNLTKILRFPRTEFIVDGDLFFKKIWKMIDSSKDYFWMTTYAINSSPAADTTLLKLIEASKRGVHVVLFIENVQNWAKPELIQKLQNCGGRFLLLNPQFQLKSIKNYINRDVWRRHHEKLIVSDGQGLIGSANIEGSYASIKYGSCQFQDLNYLTENIVLDEYRQHFADTADTYGFSLHTHYENETVLERLNRKWPNSEFYPRGKYRLLHNDPLKKQKEIEESVISMVERSKEKIKIIQPYHYPMIRFDGAMARAAQRGVQAEILTSGQRDQPVFRSLFNYMLFERLIERGIEVHETKERLLHSKVYMSDGGYFNMGSMNNDRWSWRINNQVNLEVHDWRDWAWLENYFQRMKQRSRPVTHNYELSASRRATIAFWQNFLYLMETLMSKQGRPEEAYVPPNADPLTAKASLIA